MRKARGLFASSRLVIGHLSYSLLFVNQKMSHSCDCPWGYNPGNNVRQLLNEAHWDVCINSDSYNFLKVMMVEDDA